MNYADVFVGYPVDGSFTYRIPDGMDVRAGMRVRVNFRGRTITAFVHRTHNDTPEKFEAKDITAPVDGEPIFDHRLVDLCATVAASYLSTTGESMAMALPSGRRPSKRFKNPFERRPAPEITLTVPQRRILDDITAPPENGGLFHLLFGVTGSGKTEVYIEAARHYIKHNKSVIYLVPEISLSSQIFERLYSVFGDDLILYHSQLTANQRLYNWMRFFRGDAKIAVGTRSSVFLQCPDLGLIIVDEEHDSSYKEHSTPRYNARRVAYIRAKSEGATVLMGSATPSIESLYSAEKGLLRLHSLTGRFGEAVLPEIHVVGVNPRTPGDMVSSLLKLYTKRAIDGGRQAIYLLNRRGFSPFVVCDECGKVIECPHCNISMNYHRDGSLLCHYCGYSLKMPGACIACGADALAKVGSGTQRVEETIAETFRGARIFRLDHDSAGKKGAVFDLIEKMKTGGIDILLGTQMVAKGFDFHNVEVVGVILADIGLNLPDFRASERIFSLLMQVAGRCGRGGTPGRVIIQTLNEEHYILEFLKKHDYYGFYRHELAMRKSLGYPPFARIVRLLARGRNEDCVTRAIADIAARLRSAAGVPGNGVRILGPSPAPLGRIAGNFRHHVMIISGNMAVMRGMVRSAREAALPRDVYLEIDVDPSDML